MKVLLSLVTVITASHFARAQDYVVVNKMPTKYVVVNKTTPVVPADTIRTTTGETIRWTGTHYEYVTVSGVAAPRPFAGTGTSPTTVPSAVGNNVSYPAQGVGYTLTPAPLMAPFGGTSGCASGNCPTAQPGIFSGGRRR